MSNGQASPTLYKIIKTVLVSQPKPQTPKSPYFELEQKYNIRVDFRSFIHVEGIQAKDFRKQKIYPEEYTAVILLSKNAADHYFRLIDEMRVKINPETKYFCSTEQIANYLSKFIIFRKRKVFSGERKIEELKANFIKHKSEKFLLPTNEGANNEEILNFLSGLGVEAKEASMYRAVSSDLSDLDDVKYDMLVFFSPLDIKSLYENFPHFSQDETRIAVFGKTTALAVEERKLRLDVMAPAPESPSMNMALENYLKKSNV
jgi:uroporphyrinogen-III synthase